MSTLVACELLSDVHELCGKRNDNVELVGLRRYLVQDRGWRYLAVLDLLGVRGLSCGRELVALLVALYPVALQEKAGLSGLQKSRGESANGGSPTRNQYLRFRINDDTVDTIDIVPHARRKSAKGSGGRRSFSSREANAPLRRRYACKHVTGAAKIHQNANQKQKRISSILEARRNMPDDMTTSESETPTDGVDLARSLTLKIRLNPMDFEYFTSIVRSDEEQKWQAELYQLPARPVRKTSRDYIDERIQNVLGAGISNFEISLLIIQLLQGLRDYDTPAEQTPAVQVLKFAVDTLWSLQLDGSNFNGRECAILKASAAKLMLMALERALRADEPTTAVIHNGLVPMTLRLLEDACSKPVNVLEPEEGSLLQEFIFATIYGIVAFLYCLLHQRGSNIDKLSDFLELFQLFVESQDGKLVERTVFAIVDLPSVDPAKSIVRAKKIIDMIGALTSDLKRVRHDLSHVSQCCKTKHKSCVNGAQNYHHSNTLGSPYSVQSTDKQACCISSLFMTLISLLRQSHLFANELKVRLINVITATGTCCCFPPRILFSNIVAFLGKRDSFTYASIVTFLERTVFKELGAYPITNACRICDRPADYSWDFLEKYVDLLSPSDPTLCYTVMAHLLKVTPSSRFHVREQLLFKVFYPILLRAKACYTADNGDVTAKFLLQSCISVTSCLIVNAQMCDKFMEINGLTEILPLMSDAAFTKCVYALLEVAVAIEIRKMCREVSESFDANDGIQMSATKSLFESLDKETDELLSKLPRSEKEPKLRERDGNQQAETSDDNREVEHLSATIVRKTIDGLDEERRAPAASNTQQPKSDARREQSENKTDDTIDAVVSSNSFENLHTLMERACNDAVASFMKFSLYQASAAWRAAAGVALCSPKFRAELSAHPVSRKSLHLFKLLAAAIATDSIEGSIKT